METPELKAQRLLDAYYNQRQGHEDPTPDGYVSVDEIMQAKRCSRSHVFRMMAKLVKAGIVQRILLRKFRNGKILIVTYFK